MNFKVDGLGFRRMKEEVVGQGQSGFVYDLAASDTPGLAPLVAEYDQNGNLVAKYHHDGGGLIAMTRNNSSYWYGFEAIGTTRQLIGSQGQVVDAYTFDAWGNELTSPQSQVPNPFKYVGKHGYYLDTESALMLLGVRYYEVNIGRFLSLDPINNQWNWYIYSDDNPIVKIDPKGLCPVIICARCILIDAKEKRKPRFEGTKLCLCTFFCYIEKWQYEPRIRFSWCPPFIFRYCELTFKEILNTYPVHIAFGGLEKDDCWWLCEHFWYIGRKQEEVTKLPRCP